MKIKEAQPDEKSYLFRHLHLEETQRQAKEWESFRMEKGSSDVPHRSWRWVTKNRDPL